MQGLKETLIYSNNIQDPPGLFLIILEWIFLEASFKPNPLKYRVDCSSRAKAGQSTC